MECMLTFHISNVYVDKTQPRQFKFTFNGRCIVESTLFRSYTGWVERVVYQTRAETQDI